MAERKHFHYFQDTLRKVPHTNGRYTLELRERDGLHEPFLFDAEDATWTLLGDTTTLVIFNKVTKVTTAWLVFFTWSPLYDCKYYALELEVGFKDKSLPYNYHPSNLYWRIPHGGVEDPDKKNYYIIPSHSFYSVNKYGKVWNRKYKHFLAMRKSSTKKENYYINLGMFNNTWHADTIGQHKAMAMGLLRLDACPFKMTVNHISGVKYNNVLGDLEWASYSMNNIHAKDENLNKARDECLLCDYRKKKVLKFISISHCGYYIGIGSDKLFNSYSRNNSIIYGRYEVAKVQDFTRGKRVWTYKKPFNKCHDVEAMPYTSTFHIRLAAYDILNKKIIIAADQYELSKILNLDTRHVLKELFRANKRIIEKTYLIGYYSEIRNLIKKYQQNPEVFDYREDNKKYNGYVMIENLKDGNRKIKGYISLYTLAKTFGIFGQEYEKFKHDLVNEGSVDVGDFRISNSPQGFEY